MATNENVNKVIYGNQTVMDITDTTAEESDVASGEVFYKANGARSVGTLNKDSAVWGQITGDINDQSDLQTELATKSTHVRLTKAQYDALTTEEKHDTTKVYYITDYTPMPVNAELNDTVTASDKVWSSQKVASEINALSTSPDIIHLAGIGGWVLPENIKDSSKWNLTRQLSFDTSNSFLEDNTSQTNYYLYDIGNGNATVEYLKAKNYKYLVAVLFTHGSELEPEYKSTVIGSVPLDWILKLKDISGKAMPWEQDFKVHLKNGSYYAFGRVKFVNGSSGVAAGVDAKILFYGESGVVQWGVTLYAI